MKKMISLLLAAAMIFAFAAAGAETDERTRIIFCLDWTPNTNHTGIYAAQALGYYDEAGLDVQIVQPPENGAVLMCAAGQAQFAVDAQDTMAASLDLEHPLGVTAVAAILQHNTSGILSREGDGITSAKGLEGKVYATWDSPVEQAMLRYCMEKEGADFDRVRLIPNNITDEPAALSAHQTDAVWIFYGWSGINAEVSGVPCDFWDFASLSDELDYYTPVIVANTKTLEEDPEMVRAFLRATEKGYKDCIADPDSAAEILHQYAPDYDAEMLRISQEILADKYIADAPAWGVMKDEVWDNYTEFMVEYGILEETIPADACYTNAFLPEAE